MAEAAKCVFKQIACAVHSGSGLLVSGVCVGLGDSSLASRTVRGKLWTGSHRNSHWDNSYDNRVEKVAGFAWHDVYASPSKLEKFLVKVTL